MAISGGTKSANMMTEVEPEPEEYPTPRNISLRVTMKGVLPPPKHLLLVLYNGETIMEETWCDETKLERDVLPINLRNLVDADIVANQPLVFILRKEGTKSSKSPDPLQHNDNKAGATVDLLPLVLGEENVDTNLVLVSIETGEPSGLTVDVFAHSVAGFDERVPLTITMISAHCLPGPVKDGTVYVAAIGLDELVEPVIEPVEGSLVCHFGMSLSSETSNKIVWAATSTFGFAGRTANNVPNEDIFIPSNMNHAESTVSAYWFAMKRVLVDAFALQERFRYPFHIEVAGVPRNGKNEARGRYMGSVDARVLLEPGQFGVTTSCKLIYFNEAQLPADMQPLLTFPPMSAKASARLTTGDVIDERGHSAYVIIRFDLPESLTHKVKLVSLFETLGYSPPEASSRPKDELYVEPPPDDPSIDVRRIRKECGALAVHKELSRLACRASVPINQGIKRTAANRLLMRVRAMLKQFPPGDCSLVKWQDTVTSQHAASRRAVTASFAPQPPPPRPPGRFAATRAAMAGSGNIAKKHIETNLKIAPTDPKALMAKALQFLEAREESEALTYLESAVDAQKRNRFILWAFGAQLFDKGVQGLDRAAAAFQIAVKGDHSDGTANAISWAALHALYHYQGNEPAAFVAAKRMRKSYELKIEWKGLLHRWENGSGQEEILWFPRLVSSEHPLVVAAAFFLSLRGYRFSELLLRCYECECGSRGSRLGLKTRDCPDVVYIRAASLLLRRFYDDAMVEIQRGISRFGPCSILSQIRSATLLTVQGWNGVCENAFNESERFGVEPGPAMLIDAALGGMRTNPKAALQRAARSYKMAPSAFSALVIGRVYSRLDEPDLAERWAAAAVKLEPLLADGWAFLAILAMYQRNVNKSRAMLRTAKQAGKISEDLQEDLKRISAIVQGESLPEALMKDLCLCDYY